jgi:hypothetical protein
VKRLILAALIAACAAVWPAQSTLLLQGAGYQTPPASGGSVTWNPQTAPACQVGGYATTSASFTGVPIGVGTVVLAIADDNNRTYSSVVINGNSATTVSATPGVGLYYVTNASGTIGTITFSTSVAFNVLCISTGYFTNLNSATPTTSSVVLADTFAPEPISLGTSVTVSSGGYGLVAVGSAYTAAGCTGGIPANETWTGAINDSATNACNTGGNTQAIGIAHFTATGTPALSCAGNCAYSGTQMAAGAWR